MLNCESTIHQFFKKMLDLVQKLCICCVGMSVYIYVITLSLSCVQHFCNSMDCSPWDFSIPGISQARILKWVAVSFSRGSSQLMNRTYVSFIGRQILYHCATWKTPVYIYQFSSVAQSFRHVQFFCNPTNWSPPGSSVHGIFQARILKWVATDSSRGSPQPRDGTHVFCVSCIGRPMLYH